MIWLLRGDPMLIEQIVESVKLSDAQQSVIDYILKERGNIKDQTIKEIAKVTYTSTGTIICLAKKLGYHGFEEFNAVINIIVISLSELIKRTLFRF